MIVILGIFNADTAYRADRMPRPGETIMGKGFALGPGGKGSNQAVAAARAGGEVSFISRLGPDAFADLARSVWAEAGVTPSVTVDADSHTGAAFIFLDAATGENAIIVAAGAGARISPSDLDARRDLIAGAKVFVAQLEQPVEAARRGLEIARAAGVVTILNPAPAAVLDDAMLALVDYLTPNETEAELLTGLPVSTLAEAEAAADALLARGVGAVVMTLGSRGALYHDAEKSFVTPAFLADPVVDTTGAGDTFLAVMLASALLRGVAPDALALAHASRAAAITVSRRGTLSAFPGSRELAALLTTDGAR